MKYLRLGASALKNVKEFDMKRNLISVVSVLAVVFAAISLTNAQLRLPRPSQWASVTQTIGVTDITISYSRPGVKGRPIFGEVAEKDNYVKGEATLDDQYKRAAGMPIVPYGHVWRTGANEATLFVVTDDVMINGQKLAAGKYSLHTIPGKDEWTVVFNGAANQWGSFDYDPAKDTLRVKAKPQTVTDNQEWLAFSIDPVTDNSAMVNIRWEKVRVPFTVQVDVAATTLVKARKAVAEAKPDDWRTPLNAAGYAKQNGAQADANAWLEAALKAADTSIANKPTFMGYVGKFNVLWNAGKKDEAFAIADKAITQGKTDKADTTAFEKRIADLKAGKM
jgi:hypothetical protein